MTEERIDNSVFEALPELELMALCIWAEARNQGLEGMQAVGSVILNRASRPGWWGRDIRSVILKPKQFSCLNPDDPQRERMKAIAADFYTSLARDPRLRECFWIARGLQSTAQDHDPLGGKAFLSSNVDGATYYHTHDVKPAWDTGMKLITVIRDHIFYAG